MPLKKDIVVLGAKTTPIELIKEFTINYIYGLVGNSIAVFAAKEMDTEIFFNFIVYYLFLSIIINRQKYQTSFGKFGLFPIASALGAFSGYKLAIHLSEIL